MNEVVTIQVSEYHMIKGVPHLVSASTRLSVSGKESVPSKTRKVLDRVSVSKIAKMSEMGNVSINYH